MEVLNIERRFKYNSVTLPDPNPDMSADEVREFYATQFPELLNAVVEGPETKEHVSTYTFTRAAGAKGTVKPAPAAEIVLLAAQAPREKTVDALAHAVTTGRYAQASNLIGSVALDRQSASRPLSLPSQAFGLWG